MKISALISMGFLCGAMLLATDGLAVRNAEAAGGASPTRLVYLLRDGTLTPTSDTPPHAILHGSLKDKSGAVQGTLDVVLIGTFSAPGSNDTAAVVSAVATLADGSISAQGRAILGDSTPPFSMAVTGGTARFRGARGVVEVTPSQNDGEAKLVYRLMP